MSTEIRLDPTPTELANARAILAKADRLDPEAFVVGYVRASLDIAAKHPGERCASNIRVARAMLAALEDRAPTGEASDV